ncbi:MAG: hypothetical protein Q4G70_02080 [Pseudomonadota bacterium]|nr:hypothetical protein [Pseudomonadota bacterium]
MAWAQPTLVYRDELLPTRMVLCQREIGPTAKDRKSRLSQCLARRYEGERVVERDCKRQASSVSGATARLQAQRDCERQALAVPFAKLPRRPPPPPRPVSAPDAAPASAAPAPMVMPAAGEQ